jgi:hypothetical protein
MMTMMLVLLSVALLEQDPAAAPTAPVILPAESQIAAAVQAAPEDRRMGATVLGYDAAGALVTLRPGVNDIVCLADDPKDAAFSVACYHKDLEPFMARGRALAAKGVNGNEPEETRGKEIESGAIKMSREPRTLHVLTGSGFDPSTGTIADAYLRWVIYTPFATPETTGLAIRPVPGGPWLMFPGTPTAHIMISPAKPAK